MALTIKGIRDAKSDEKLLDLLLAELGQLLPPELRDDAVTFHSRLQTTPIGLRAMATTFDLDVSMALDDLAWHFVNYHSSLDLAEETILGLRELEAFEAAKIFAEVFAVVKPHWPDLDAIENPERARAWLDTTGIQNLMNPLSKRMWDYLNEQPNKSLLNFWTTYARKYPDRCIESP